MWPLAKSVPCVLPIFLVNGSMSCMLDAGMAQELNHTAVRKIIKKFDKRFHVAGQQMERPFSA